MKIKLIKCPYCEGTGIEPGFTLAKCELCLGKKKIRINPKTFYKLIKNK